MNKKRSGYGSDIFREDVGTVDLWEVLETVREPLVILDKNFKVTLVNEIFCRAFWVLKENIEGKIFFDYGNYQWKISKLEKALRDLLYEGGFIQGYEINHHFSIIGPKTLLINARRIYRQDNLGKSEPAILIAIEDISEITEVVKKFNIQTAQYQLLLEGEKIQSRKHPKDFFGLNTVLKKLDVVASYFIGFVGRLKNRTVIRP